MVDNRGMDNGGGGVGSGVVDNRGGVVGGSSMVYNRGGVVSRSRSIRSRVGEGSGSVHGSDRLLVVSISMDRLRSSMGLAGDASVDSAMGLVDGNGDGRGISNLDDLVVGLVGGSHSQESGADEGLHVALGMFDQLMSPH